MFIIFLDGTKLKIVRTKMNPGMQFLKIKNANLCKNVFVSYDVTSLFTNIPLQETIGIAINLIFNHDPNLNITKKNFKNFLFSLDHRLILFITVSFIIKLME